MSSTATLDALDDGLGDALDWAGIAHQLGLEGYALLPGLLASANVLALATETGRWRRVPLASSDLGRGDRYDCGADLPGPLASLRQALYPHLASIANRWNQILGVGYRYPASLQAFLLRNREAGQTRGLSYLSRLGESDYLALHQRAEGEHVFPLQLVGLLSAPGEDFTGGEFVMTEQRPRMQSRPMVLPLRRGDAALIGTAQRPFKGSNGYYRVNLKHAVSRVRSGQRIGVELSFHDGP